MRSCHGGGAALPEPSGRAWKATSRLERQIGRLLCALDAADPRDLALLAGNLRVAARRLSALAAQHAPMLGCDRDPTEAP